jgi:hypothetical protein
MSSESPSWSSEFEFGACQVINLNASSCASHFLTEPVPIEELFFMSVSLIFSGGKGYNPFLDNGGQDLNYIEEKYGYLLDMFLTIGGIVIIPETIILLHKYL